MTCCQTSDQTTSDKDENWYSDKNQHDKVRYDIRFSILTKSTLIIHRKVTSCQTSAKQPQIKMKIGMLINTNMTRSNMPFIVNVDKIHINYT